MRRPVVLLASILALAACRGGEPVKQQQAPEPGPPTTVATPPIEAAPAAKLKGAPGGTVTASDGTPREMASLWANGCAVLSFYRGRY